MISPGEKHQFEADGRVKSPPLEGRPSAAPVPVLPGSSASHVRAQKEAQQIPPAYPSNESPLSLRSTSSDQGCNILTPEEVTRHQREREEAKKIIESASRSGFSTLVLDGLDLSALPEPLLKCLSEQRLSSNLKRLHLQDNRLVLLPRHIASLRQLKELNLENNRIVCLPDEIGNLKSLERLHLTNNRLVSLPASIGNCTSLKRLFLGQNELATLPNGFSRLKSLLWLCLDDNPLSGLPLEVIYYSFRCRPFPTRANKSGSDKRRLLLTLLNYFICIGTAQCCELRKLSWLSMERCRMSRLPEQIADLTNLSYLSLMDNMHLRILPMEIGTLPKLEDVRSNALLEFPSHFIPADSSKRDPRAIFSYLRDVVDRYGLWFDHKCHWDKDELHPKCNKCGMTFTLTKRRHHCRICGRIFCNSHTANRLAIPSMDVRRVCESCFTVLDPSNPSNVYMKRMLEYEEKEFRSYGLDRGEELLPFKEKKGKLQKQLEEINEAIIAVERSQEAFQKLIVVYERDPIARENAIGELADNRKKLNALMQTKELVQAQMEDLQEDEEDEF